MSKRNLLARGLAASGLSWLSELVPLRRCLIVLAYHRVGNPHATLYDPGVFSATADAFDRQVGYLKRRFPIVGMEEALSILDRPASCPNGAVMLTFDDGYRDNYEVAFPILRGHGVPATFFLPTSFIGTSRLPWWDAIAFMIRNSPRPRFSITYPEAMEMDVSDGTDATLQALTLFKSPANRDPDRFIAELESACGVPVPTVADRLFMTWDDARELVRGGMSVGSHTHSHEILSKLSPDGQLKECLESREILESNLQTRILSLAYPVGDSGAIDEHTPLAAAESGYRIAFSYHGGVNLPQKLKRYDILRMQMSMLWVEERFRVNLSSAAAFNSLPL